MFKRFDLESPEDQEEITFELAGETYHCLPQAPGGVLNRLMGSIRIDERGREQFSGLDLIGFLDGVLTAPDAARFREACDSRDVIIPIAKIGEICMWLSQEVYADRPTA